MRKIVLVLALSTLAAGCAPRMNKTHFTRWSEQDQRRREERAADEKVEQWMRAQAGVATPMSENKDAPASTPRSSSGQTMQTRQDTPTIPRTQTATNSRVIRPTENTTPEDDEAIY
jgi:hypothetical protein